MPSGAVHTQWKGTELSHFWQLLPESVGIPGARGRTTGPCWHWGRRRLGESEKKQVLTKLTTCAHKPYLNGRPSERVLTTWYVPSLLTKRSPWSAHHNKAEEEAHGKCTPFGHPTSILPYTGTAPPLFLPPITDQPTGMASIEEPEHVEPGLLCFPLLQRARCYSV